MGSEAFSAKDFLDIASRTTIDVALAKLATEGKIRRIRRGLYDTPKFNAALGGKLSPDVDEAAGAIARRQHWTIVPEGAWAANLLGLSTQVPSKISYLTDGPRSAAEAFISTRPIYTIIRWTKGKALHGQCGLRRIEWIGCQPGFVVREAISMLATCRKRAFTASR